MRSDLIIIDEIGYTPIERKEANQFFNLVSELYEKKSIIITSNKSFDGWAEMMGDGVMTTALLDRLLHHARVYNLTGKSYRIQINKEDKMLIKAIDEYLQARPEDERAIRCFHPSSLHKSAKKLYEHYLNDDNNQKFESRILRIFDKP